MALFEHNSGQVEQKLDLIKAEATNI
uniref:Uncharacterized protein n=1 Tax=Rhizophora mucronata TaxID=61149 RepID=A0A2P2P9V5_RHIMU